MADGPKMIFSLSTDACAQGGNAGGAYLDSIGKTDLSALSKEQWDHFCCCIVHGAWVAALDKKLVELERPIVDDEIPF